MVNASYKPPWSRHGAPPGTSMMDYKQIRRVAACPHDSGYEPPGPDPCAWRYAVAVGPVG